MMKNEKISIVVPIYNVEEYLPRCLDSIIAQTYSNIEIMLVDDGSPDNAGAICDEYAARDSRIRVFHIPNGGVAKARQLGVESSTGEYIVFVDPDDWLPLDSIEVLYKPIALNRSIDIVIGSYIRKFLSRDVYCHQVERNYSKREYIDAIIATDIIVAPWAKLFRRDLFVSDGFPNIKRSQDWLMNIHIAIRSNGCCAISQCVYYYDCSSEVSSRNKHNAWVEYYLQVASMIKKILEERDLFNDHSRSWALGTMHVVFSKLKSDIGNVFHSDNSVLKEALSYIDSKSLKTSSRIKFYTLKSTFVRSIVLRACIFKSYIKKVCKKIL